MLGACPVPVPFLLRSFAVLALFLHCDCSLLVVFLLSSCFVLVFFLLCYFSALAPFSLCATFVLILSLVFPALFSLCASFVLALCLLGACYVLALCLRCSCSGLVLRSFCVLPRARAARARTRNVSPRACGERDSPALLQCSPSGSRTPCGDTNKTQFAPKLIHMLAHALLIRLRPARSSKYDRSETNPAPIPIVAKKNIHFHSRSNQMGRTPPERKNRLHFSICACHPCAGGMLIFPVSFQF